MSKKQITIAYLSTEAEYIAALEASKELLWIDFLLKKLCPPDIYPIPLYCNNQGSILPAKNQKKYQQTQYIDVDYQYIGENKQACNINIIYLPSGQVILDRLSHEWTSTKVKLFIKPIGLQRNYLSASHLFGEEVCQDLNWPK